MVTRMLAISVVLLSTTGCIDGKFVLHGIKCSVGQERSAGGQCAASDKAPPTVSLSTDATTTNANPLLVTATFSKDVEGLSADGVTVTNGQVASITGEGAVYVISITPQQDGEVAAQLKQGAAKSLSGKESAASNRLTFSYDGTAPTLSLVSIDRSALDMSATPDPTLTLQLSEAANVTLYKDDACSQTLTESKVLQAGADHNIKVDAIDRVSKTHIYGKGVDTLGNASDCTSLATYVHILKFEDPNPGASNGFGTHIVELANGNVAITSPQATINGVSQAGAVYLFNGETGALISTLHGSTASDNVGNGGITALPNGNYVVRSINWDNAAVSDAGAVTFGDGTAGISGAVNTANSLVGSSASDRVGQHGVVVLANGNYVVRSNSWDNGAINSAGAVTWGSGTTGVSGAISAANSLVGSATSDMVGSGGVTALTNGNYVAGSPFWNNGATADVGAATWGDGTTGVSGVISAGNSLIGSTAQDYVGFNGIVLALTNGNYVVGSPNWDNGAINSAGAVTWGSGTTGVSGVISAANSLVGSTAGDQVGSTGRALTNGNFVMASPFWDNGAVTDAGAVTWGNGATGITGTVSAANSLVGSTASDQVGGSAPVALVNGNYVVNSYQWDNGAVTDAGAVTWGNGATGITGAVSTANSLVGSATSDRVGNPSVTALANGNYVVASRFWANGAIADAGAVTWCNGTAGMIGTVSAANSLVGSMASDQVGGSGVVALSNGNYVVGSINWDNDAISNAGAVTFGDGTTGVSGAVTAANSLVGSTASDQVGFGGVTALSNGNYAVRSPNWDNGTISNAGAVTWGSGTSGVSGVISATNSLVGSTASDQLGNSTATATSDGNLIFRSSAYNGNMGLVIKIPGSEGVAGSL